MGIRQGLGGREMARLTPETGTVSGTLLAQPEGTACAEAEDVSRGGMLQGMDAIPGPWDCPVNTDPFLLPSQPVYL